MKFDPIEEQGEPQGEKTHGRENCMGITTCAFGNHIVRCLAAQDEPHYDDEEECSIDPQ